MAIPYLLFVLVAALGADSHPSGLVSVPLRRINDGYYVQLHVGPHDKQTRLSIDISSAATYIECNSHSSVFKKILNFLKDPFYQQFNYRCPELNTDSLLIKNVGSIDIPFQPIVDKREYGGRLGLQGDGDFLKYLPEKYRVFSIFINSNDYGRPSRIDFGGYDSAAAKGQMAYIPLVSKSPWSVTLSNIDIEELRLEGGNAVLNTIGKKLGMPLNAFNAFFSLLRKKHECKNSQNTIFCSCIGGDLGQLPQINLHFGTKTVTFYPQAYVDQSQDKCMLLFEPSSNDQWILSLPFFKDNVVVFEHGHILVGQAAQINPISQTTKSPIQTVLNSAVVILVCVFVSLVVIQIIRRVSGFANARDQTIHDIMRRTQ